MEDYLGKVFKIERQIKELRLDRERTGGVLTSEEVVQWRRERTAPILTAFKQWLDDLLPGTAPQSALGKAVAYTVRQWPKLMLHQEHGEVPIHNNATENEIRPFSQGRRVWLFAHNPLGARASANLFSLVGSARANGLEPYRYLHYSAPGQTWCFQRVKFLPRQEVQPPHRESSLESEEVTNRAKRRQSDARAVTKVKQFSLVKYLSAGQQHRIGWEAPVGAPRKARWPETAAGSKCTARSEKEASRDLGDPLRSWSALRADRVCRTIWLTPEKGRCRSAKSDSLVVLRARESRVHGEAAKQMTTDLRETSPAPTEAGA
jgi:Transposase IS66 family